MARDRKDAEKQTTNNADSARDSVGRVRDSVHSIKIVDYNPGVKQHPEYTATVPEFEVDDAVVLTKYDHVGFLEPDSNDWIAQRRLTGMAQSQYEQGNTNLRSYRNIVLEIDRENRRARLLKNDLFNRAVTVWVRFARIIDVTDPERLKKIRRERYQQARERKQKARRAYDRFIAEREAETDLDALMDDVIEHARTTVNKVWPGEQSM